MKRISQTNNQIISLVIAGILFMAITGCSKKINFSRSSVVPAAEGKVKIKKDKNKNYSIDINIFNLAEAGNLVPPKKTYVVWMETDQSSTTNIGQLKSSSGMLSKALKASLNTISTFKPTRIFVTAEDDATVSYPQGQTIMTTGNF
jgi:argininosuccinate synthase